jgi:hypothetical protein
MQECMYIGCSEAATHILVTYNHEVIGDGEFYCQQHAFEEGRKECPYCCYHDLIGFSLEAGDGKLLPTYPDGTLDDDGGCLLHP